MSTSKIAKERIQTHSKMDKNKKRKILLGTLLPISVGLIALSFGLGFGLGYTPQWISLNSKKDVEKLINKNKKTLVHNDKLTWTSPYDYDALSYFENHFSYKQFNIAFGCMQLLILSTNNVKISRDFLTCTYDRNGNHYEIYAYSLGLSYLFQFKEDATTTTFAGELQGIPPLSSPLKVALYIAEQTLEISYYAFHLMYPNLK